MPSTISRLKSTDSLGQWASKTNQIIDTVEGFLSTAGSITSGNSLNYIATYSGSTWVGYPASGDVSAAISSGNLVFTLTTAAFTGKTVTSSITPASDLILIYSGGAVKTVTPAILATPGGSNTYVQYNNSGSFGGASGFTFASGVLSVPTGLNVNTNNLFVGSSKVGIGTGSPATALDVYGNISISGTQVLSSTTLGSGVVNSSLTSVGTLGSLTVTGTASVGSLSSSGSIQGASLNITGAATVTGAASVGSLSLSSNVITLQGLTRVSGVPTLKITSNTNGQGIEIYSGTTSGYNYGFYGNYIQYGDFMFKKSSTANSDPSVNLLYWDIFSNLTINPSGGNVGIGTTSISNFALGVNGYIAAVQASNTYCTVGINPASSSSPTTYAGMWYDTTSNILRIEALSGGVAWRNVILQGQGSGNVGIGTASPFAKTTISKPVTNTVATADASNTSHLTLAGSDSLVRLQLGCGGGSLGPNGGWIQSSYDNGGGSNGTEPLSINPSGGNVGIGTTSPGYLLDVNGSQRIVTSLGVGTAPSGTTGEIRATALDVSGAATVTGVLTGRTNVVNQSTSLNPVVAQTTYVVGATSLTLTLPSSPTTGDKISFVPSTSSINNYTIARNGNTIMGLSSDLTVDTAVPFDLIYNGSGWVLS